jgi:hypothetical protein
VGQEVGHFRSAMAKESTREKWKSGKVSAQKKNCEGFPLFVHLKIFKTALKSDVK